MHAPTAARVHDLAPLDEQRIDSRVLVGKLGVWLLLGAASWSVVLGVLYVALG